MPCSCPGSVLVVCCRVEVWHILFVLNSLYSVFNILVCIQHTINVVLLWYMADFLLVNIYTLVKRLRDRELRVRISGIAADLAHFYA